MNIDELLEKDLSLLSREELLKIKEHCEEQAGIFDASQMAEKIAINALYGALSNQYFILFNIEIAKGITSNSRFYINLLGNYLNNYMKSVDGSNGEYLIYIDTDSNYLKFPEKIMSQISSSPMSEKVDFLSNWIEDKIQPEINSTSSKLGEIFNALSANKISAKREAISDVAVFLSKKKYFMSVRDSEGVRYPDDNPYIKKMGIEIIRSSTPAFSKKHLSDSIKTILFKNESELKTWLSDIRNYYKSADLMDIAKVSSISSANYNLGVDKSIPINSRAFLVTNNYINNLKSNEFQPLELGEKVRMLYLKTPNPLKSNIFAFNNEKFARLFLEYIDYDTNFEKFFMSPLEIMTTPLKFKIRKSTEELEVW